jgi:hypothetical protein
MISSYISRAPTLYGACSLKKTSFSYKSCKFSLLGVVTFSGILAVGASAAICNFKDAIDTAE